MKIAAIAAAVALAAFLYTKNAKAQTKTKPKNLGALVYAYPLEKKYPIFSNYRTARRPKHQGIDISPSGEGRENIAVHSASAGVVEHVGFEANGAGHYVVVKADEQDEHGRDVFFLYFHLRDKPPVKNGDAVEAGQNIGICGTTGRSEGIHLHFEIRTSANGRWYLTDAEKRQGVQIDTNPVAFMQKRGIDLDVRNG